MSRGRRPVQDVRKLMTLQLLSQMARVPRRRYFGANWVAVSLGSGTRVIGLILQVAVLALLSRMMHKAEFGDMMTAFGFYRFAAAAIGVGPSTVLLFHVARCPDDRTLEIGLHRFCVLLGVSAGLVVAVAGFASAHAVAAFVGKPGLAFWFRALAPLAVFHAALVIATGALEGRSQISQSIVVSEVLPNAVRVLCLPVISFLRLSSTWIAWVLICSAIVAWLWSARRLWRPIEPAMRRWSVWDCKYCGKSAIAALFAFQLNAADILIAGALFSSAVVADYVIAARIAVLFSFFGFIVLKQFSPIAGRLLAANDPVALRRKVETFRGLVIGAVTLTIAALLAVAPLVLPLFGNYKEAQNLLIWLSIPALIQCFYAASDRLLIMSGHTTVALVVTFLSFLTLVGVPLVTARWLGALSIPLAMALASLLFQPIVAWKVKMTFGIRTISRREMFLLVCGLAAAINYAAAPHWPNAILACGVFVTIAIYALLTANVPAAGGPCRA